MERYNAPTALQRVQPAKPSRHAPPGGNTEPAPLAPHRHRHAIPAISHRKLNSTTPKTVFHSVHEQGDNHPLKQICITVDLRGRTTHLYRQVHPGGGHRRPNRRACGIDDLAPQIDRGPAQGPPRHTERRSGPHLHPYRSRTPIATNTNSNRKGRARAPPPGLRVMPTVTRCTCPATCSACGAACGWSCRTARP